MKIRVLILSAVVLLSTFGLAMTVRGQTEGFIITEADDSLLLGLAPSATLNSLITNIASRFLMEAADANREYNFSPAPSELLTLVGQAADRFLMEAADANRLYVFSPVPVELLDLVSQAADRFLMEAADSNRYYQLAYPTVLINDTTAPVLINIAVQPAGPDSVAIIWETDEFADSAVHFGTKTTEYDQTATDPLYAKSHEVILSGLSEQVAYYFVVVSRDQSGNTRQSTERSFEILPMSYVYLPIVVR